jgi:pimeloyl-ACP methyl ester carboxylesterase
MTRPCVVLLPGLMCDAAVWSAQCEALSFADGVLPSYGALSAITGMARHVLESAPAQRFSLAGHSMGGRVALEVARLAVIEDSGHMCTMEQPAAVSRALQAWLRGA